MGFNTLFRANAAVRSSARSRERPAKCAPHGLIVNVCATCPFLSCLGSASWITVRTHSTVAFSAVTLKGRLGWSGGFTN